MTLVGRICRAVEPVFEGALALDAGARARVERLEGKGLEIHITGLDWHIHLVPAAGRLLLTDDPEVPPAARIGGPPTSLAALATTGGTRVLFGGSLHVSGDVQVAKAYKRLFDTLDPDWEEALARVMGDIPAHETARMLRAAGTRAARIGADRRTDLRAWLVDEIEALPARGEVDDWMDAVDRLRADADRLAARVNRLERQGREDP
jgi:ubiquinone biosynthesis protein UbiJ